MEPDRDLRLRLPLSGSHWGPSWVLRRPSGQRWRLGVVGAPAGCWPPARSPPCSAAQPGAHVARPCRPEQQWAAAALRPLATSRWALRAREGQARRVRLPHGRSCPRQVLQGFRGGGAGHLPWGGNHGRRPRALGDPENLLGRRSRPEGGT